MLVYSGQISLDGYLVDAEGRFDWAMPTPEIHAFVNELERGTQLHLLGRRMYEVMRYWDSHERGGDDALAAASDEWAELWAHSDKVVYSTTLEEVGARARLERDFQPDEVADAIQGRRASIGGAALGAQALAAGLIDEVWSIRYPVAVGGGVPWLPREIRAEFALLDQHRFANGAVYERYAVVGARGASA
jgi:dihydrofolate reductase